MQDITFRETDDVGVAAGGVVTHNYRITVQELFERTVEKYADHDAIYVGEQRMSYATFNKKVNKLAHHLRNRGIGANDIVAILADRSFEMLIGIYGIIKAGGAYLPLSHSDPSDRLRSLLEDANPKLLLVQNHLSHKSDDLYDKQLVIEDVLNEEGCESNPELINQPEDLAYVIYTSGSTGMPKGVMISHQSLINRLQWMQDEYPISREDVIVQKTPFTFDVSVWELFWWAFEGARVAMLGPDQEKNPMAIASAISKYEVTTIHFVPSMFSVFLQYLKFGGNVNELAHLRTVFTSGEALKENHLHDFNELFGDFPDSRLVNLYGPTEATIDATHYLCPKQNEAGNVPIGLPISNMKAYILKDDKIAGEGETGELCLAGIGLARGYLNRVELTHDRFSRHPENPEEIIYKTGDQARISNNGNIDYLGRIDQQIKIRGIRIELGEIEATVARHSSIQQCVAALRRPSDHVTLIVVYYLADEAIDQEELKKFTRNFLPAYMVPNFFCKIDQIPVTAHGKVDRNLLPDLNSLN